MIYVITGHLGSGKTLLAVQLAIDYLKAGRRVASNMTLYLDRALPALDRSTAVKVPYIPTAEHLRQLGFGCQEMEADPDFYSEEKFGLLLLDEGGTWLNSRNWNDKERAALFQWITHARKYGWDVILIIQDFESLDAQIRRSVTEAYVTCSRLDRIKVPYLPVRLPKSFKATARYREKDGPVFKSWFSWGDDIFKCYRTKEAVVMEEFWTPDGPIDARGSYSMLSAWHLKGRHLEPKKPVSVADAFLRACTAPLWLLVVLPARLLAGAPLVAQPRQAAGRKPAPVDQAQGVIAAERSPNVVNLAAYRQTAVSGT